MKDPATEWLRTLDREALLEVATKLLELKDGGTHEALNEDRMPEPIQTEPIEPTSREATAMRMAFAWIVDGRSVRSVLARLILFSWAMGFRPEVETYQHVSEVTGLTRAAVQRLADELKDTFGVTVPNRKCDETRERNRARAASATRRTTVF